MKRVVIFLSLILSACSKESHNEGVMSGSQNQSPKITSYYRYLDPEIPLTYLAAATLGEGAYLNQYLGLANYNSKATISADDLTPPWPKDYNEGYVIERLGSLNVLLFKTSIFEASMEYRAYLQKEHPSGKLFASGPKNNILPSTSFSMESQSSACYANIPYGQNKTKKIMQNIWRKQVDATYSKETVPAQLQIYSRTTCAEPENLGDPKQPCEREVQWIIPQLPRGVIQEGLTAVIEVEFTVINGNDPQLVQAAKKKANDQICEALKSMTWIPAAGTPPKWDRIPGLNDHPHTKIVTENK